MTEQRLPRPRNLWTQNGSERKRLTRIVRDRRDPCYFCRLPIDYTLKWPDVRSFSVHHVEGIGVAPHRQLDLTNLAPAHLACNRAAGPAHAIVDAHNGGGVKLTTRQW